MKASRLSRAVLWSGVVLAVVTGSYAAIDLSAGGPPTVTVTSVAFSPAGVTCGVENDCLRVVWTASAPKGTTINGFDIELTATKANGTTAVSKKSINTGSTRETDIGVFQTGSNVASHVTKVTARYNSIASGSKSGAL